MKIFLNRVDIAKTQLAEENGVTTSWVQVFRPGHWQHPRYGKLEFTDVNFDGFIKNFNDKVRRIDLAIDTEHEPEKGACGWIRQLEKRDDGLWAQVEWTPRGLQLVSEGTFKYLSGDFDYEWKDEETGKKFKNVLFGAALTNRPFIKGMSPINLSEFREELEKDENIRSAFQLAEDILKLKEGDVKTDVELLAAKDEDLTPEEKTRKADLLKKKKEEEAVQLKKKLAERAKAVGLKEDADEDEIEKAEKKKKDDEKKLQDATEALKKRAKAVGLPEDATEDEVAKAEKAKKELAERAKKVNLSETATLVEIEAAEKKLQDKIGNENEQKVKIAVALGLSADATLDQIYSAVNSFIEKQRAIEGSKRTMSEEEITKLLTDVPAMEKKLTELKDAKGDAMLIKLLEDNVASKKKLSEEKIKNAKEKIELKLKEHFRSGKLTGRERDLLKTILFSEVEGEETSFKLSEKDKDGKDVEATKTLNEVIDLILSERPAIVELKEIAAKELQEPPKDGGKELDEKEVSEIAQSVAGKVTKMTKSAKKLAERAKKVGLPESATLAEIEEAEKK